VEKTVGFLDGPNAAQPQLLRQPSLPGGKAALPSGPAPAASRRESARSSAPIDNGRSGRPIGVPPLYPMMRPHDVIPRYMVHNTPMRIGELAVRAEVNIQTLRFYEREGLLRPPARTPSGYRSYTVSDLERVRFIRLCQRLGFTLHEIQHLLILHQNLTEISGTAKIPLKDMVSSRRYLNWIGH
jgi:DNA-binding transcriptional MerR regulator